MLTASIGIGGGLVMLAALAQVLPVNAIIPVHGAVQVGSNSGRALVMLKHVRWNIFVSFVAGSLLGAIIGGNLVVSLPLELLRGLLGGFILFALWGPKIGKLGSSSLALMLGGLLSTLLTMFVGATGAFVLTLFRAVKLERLELVATSAASLVVQHASKVVVFGILGFAFSAYAWLILLMIASGFIGTLMGRRILLKINEQRFQKWLNIVLSLLALRLIWMAIS